METRLGRMTRLVLGEQPRTLLLLLVPTLLSLALDLSLRARTLAGYATQGKLIYASSLLVSAAFWMLPLWLAGRLFLVREGRARTAARLGIGLFFALWVLPLATFCFAGQALYHRVFHSYMGRDTVRLGIALRGTVRDWFVAWGSVALLGVMLVVGIAITLGIFGVVRKAAPSFRGTVPMLPVLTFAGSLACFWNDLVDSRFLQAATPDSCFVHGAMHVLRVAVDGKWHARQGISLRNPAPLAPLVSERARPPNVIMILTESVRADALCSDPPPECEAPFLDAVAPDRIALGRLTSQTPNTFSACMVLWSGLPPNVDFAAAHAAPLLWELAHAVGYRTAYVTSQNPKYEDFGLYVQHAGIDHMVTATELGGMEQEQLGAPDERATAELLRYVRTVRVETPYFAVLHLANTHAPYRIDAALQPYVPHADDPLGNAPAFHAHYRNSVLLLERTIADFVRALRALPSFDDTVVLVLSDHGEQFREHGGLYHNHSLYDEELRIPGWLVAGSRALDDRQRTALRTYAGCRTYSQDVHATVVDLFGVARPLALPYGQLVSGRSLLRDRAVGQEPFAQLATSTAVWEPDDARFGVMFGEKVLMGAPSAPWICFDTRRDPGESTPLAIDACAAMAPVANKAFADKGVLP